MIAEKLVVRVCWGDRAETAEECARRWLATNRGLAALDEIFAGWVVLEGEGEPHEMREVALKESDLLPIVEAGAHFNDGVAQFDLGFNFGTLNDRQGEQRAFFQATAGMSAQIPGLLNRARIEGSPRSRAELRRWAGMAEAVLAVLVAVWEPDEGQVWTHPLLQAQMPAPREPFAGYVTYLSARRRELVPDDLAAVRRQTPDGGLLLSLIPPGGDLPPDEAVVALGARLREAGAFEPVPVDRARW